MEEFGQPPDFTKKDLIECIERHISDLEVILLEVQEVPITPKEARESLEKTNSDLMQTVCELYPVSIDNSEKE